MIEKPASILLHTKEQTLSWLAENDETFRDKYSVVSDWLCDELDRFEATGYVYNREAQERICAENGLTFEGSCRRADGQTTRTEGGLLGSLIYNAQAHRRVRKLRREGWRRWSETAAEEVVSIIGKTVLIFGNGELSGVKQAKVKRFGEKILLAPPRTRTKAFSSLVDWWIKPATV